MNNPPFNDNDLRQALAKRAWQMSIPSGWEEDVLGRVGQSRAPLLRRLRFVKYLAVACSIILIFAVGYIMLTPEGASEIKVASTEQYSVKAPVIQTDEIHHPKASEPELLPSSPKPQALANASPTTVSASEPVPRYEIIMPDILEEEQGGDLSDIDAAEYIALVISTAHLSVESDVTDSHDD